MKTSGNPQGVFEGITTADFTVFVHVRSVPIIPFIEGDADVPTFERFQFLSPFMMGLNFAADSADGLAHMLNHGFLCSYVEVFADKFHIVGAILQHTLRPGPGRADRNEFDGRIYLTHRLGE